MTAIPNNPTVIVKRRVDAPAQQIFDAWLNPSSLSEWFRPGSSTMRSTVKVDAREGGAFEIVMHFPSESRRHNGTYQIIDAPRRLAITWNSSHTGPPDSLVTVEFQPDRQATEVVITHEHLPESVRDGHAAGWTEIIESLAQEVERSKFQ